MHEPRCVTDKHVCFVPCIMLHSSRNDKLNKVQRNGQSEGSVRVTEGTKALCTCVNIMYVSVGIFLSYCSVYECMLEVSLAAHLT